MERQIPILFLSFGLVCTVTCYLRADYNPALFILSYFLWNLKPHIRQTLIYFILFSWFVDLVWIFVYLLLWRSESFTSYRTNFHNTTLLASAILFTLKLFLIVYLVAIDKNCRKWLKPNAICKEIKMFYAD